MIVRNSVILVDQIDTEIAHGRAPWDAVIEATLHRFPNPSHSGSRHSRHDPDRSDCLLGADGLLHHGRPGGCHDPDAYISAGAGEEWGFSAGIASPQIQ
jgi:hypothetical protein